MRTLFILLRTEFLSLVNSMNRKGKTPFIVAAIGLAILGLFMIAMFGFMGAATADILVGKDHLEIAFMPMPSFPVTPGIGRMTGRGRSLYLSISVSRVWAKDSVIRIGPAAMHSPL